MVHSITQRVLGRMAAVLFALIGAMIVAGSFLPASERNSASLQAAIGIGAVLAGCITWFVPWERLPARRIRIVIPAVLVALSAAGTFGSYTPYTFDSSFIVLFAWIGMAQPRGVALRMLPFTTGAYLIPVLVHDPSMLALSASIQTMFVCGLVGESLAWMSGRLRAAETLDTSRVWEMQMLLHASEMMARQAEARRAAELVASLTVQLLRSEGVAVLVVEDTDTLAAAGAFHWPIPEEGLRVEFDDLPELRRVVAENESVAIPAERMARFLELPEKTQSVLAVPMRGASGSVGLLLVSSTSREGVGTFSDHVARTFATQAGLTLERLHATEALIDETLRDELTGLGNRRLARRALARLEHNDALAMIDLDRFKDLNDSRGHAAGDLILCELATLLRSALRENDVAVRMGGDEFLLVLRGAGSAAIPTIQRLARQWSGETGLSFSAGVALYRPTETPDGTLRRADEALYRSKREGRDRISGEDLEPVVAGA